MDTIRTAGGQAAHAGATRALSTNLNSSVDAATPPQADTTPSSVHASATLASHWGELADASPVTRMDVLDQPSSSPPAPGALGGSRRFISDTSVIPQAPRKDVDRLKGLIGKVPTGKSGAVDLGQGVKGEIEPDGEFSFTVPGRRPGEAPREFSGNRQNYGEKVDVAAAKKLMDADVAHGKPAGSGSVDLGKGGSVSFDEVVGPQGTHRYQASLADGRSFEVSFDPGITNADARKQALGNISEVVSQAPAQTYARVNADGTPQAGKGVDIYVHQSMGVGASVAQNGETRYGPVGAVSSSDDHNRIDVGMPFTQNKELLGAVLDHEAGHLEDWRHQNASERPGTSFGHTQGAGTYVSRYAQSGADEDLAESHAEMLRFRQDFNQRQGQDFMTLPPAEQRKALQEGWTVSNNGQSARVEYSPEVIDKMLSVSSLYTRP